MKNKTLLLSIIIFSTLLTTFSVYFYQIFFTPNFLINNSGKKIYINDAMNFKDLQHTLLENGYVHDLLSFSFLAKIMKYNENIKPGAYIVESNMSNYNLIKKLRSGNQTPVEITFNNVKNLKELADKITQNINLTPTDFLEYVYNGNWYNSINLKPNYQKIGLLKSKFNLENILLLFLPDTYEVYWNISEKFLVEKMKTQYDVFWNSNRIKKAQDINLSNIEVGILASIIQAETNHVDEAPIIAGVYINRLRKKIPLQADPTLIFAHGDYSITRVLNIHKKINSPYNTYKNRGLPPGPINLPEKGFIDAVLNYTQHNYYFFCAKDDFSGYHVFSDNLKEHKKNAKKFQKALDKLKIFK